MDGPLQDIDAEIGARIKALRTRLALTLDDLATRSGVSRAMISRIERGESSATAQLLGRLCGGLGVTLSTLFTRAEAAPSPLSRRAEQPVWRDPGSGYVRRSVSPPAADGAVHLAEVVLPEGALVPFDRQHLTGVDQLIWILDGTLEMSVGEETHPLSAGDCLHMRFDKPITFRNPGPGPVRYAVVLSFAQPGAAR